LAWLRRPWRCDVPVTAYAVKVTCKPAGQRKAAVELTKTLPASARTVVVPLGKLKRGSCTATVKARNEIGHGPVAKAKFSVKR
jgi:hypothetical protein